MFENSCDAFQNQLKKYDFKKAKDFFGEIITFKICPWGLKKLIKHHIEDLNIVDVREYNAYIDGHIPYAIHVPVEELEEHMVMFDKNKMNIIYSCCPICLKAFVVAEKLVNLGYPVKVLLGGFEAWKEAKMDVVKTSANDDK